VKITKPKLLDLKLSYQTAQHHNDNRIVSTAVDYVIELQMFDDDSNDDDGDGGDDGANGATLVHTATLLTCAKLARL
jgi:hypothetical protein